VSEEAFAAFVAVRSTGLLRTAYLLTGDRGRAEDLVQQALITVHRGWPVLADDEQATAVARRQLVAVHTGWGTRLWLGDVLASIPALASVSMLPGFTTSRAAPEPRDATTTALAQLPAPVRAALVLRLGEGLAGPAAAELLGCPVEEVERRVHLGLDRLREVLGDDETAAADRLRVHLTARAAGITAAPGGLTDHVVDGDRSQQHHHAGLLALVVLLLVIVALVALTV
jgi:DNA-directed RNA polymerase specialized sigma24 family protein